jgi:regulator of RNase E activity RraA
MSQNKADVVCGLARTATIAGALPPEEPAETIKARRLEYFRYMATETLVPVVTVVEDLDYPQCVGAWWGEVHTVVHKGLGIRGALTNGVVRDLGDLAPEFPVIAGSIGPSHGFVHLRAIGQPAKVFGLTVNHDDLIHADQHGAVVIPNTVFSDLEAAIDRLMAAEKLILEPARAKDFNLEKLEQAWKAFEKARV